MNDQKIALLGGAFDPPHIGHLLVASQVLRSPKYRELWFVPTGDDRYDRTPVAAGDHRYEMLLRAIAPFDKNRVRICTDQLEGKLPGSYTIDLIQSLSEAHPSESFSFLIGADRLDSLNRWKDFERLKTLTSFLVVPRVGESLPSTLPHYVETLAVEPLFSTDISSSGIRKLVQASEPIVGLVPESVASYIEQHHLYRPL